MPKFFTLFLLSLITAYVLGAQVFPAEGAKLNYRLIGFSFPAHPAFIGYNIQIAAGYFNSIDSFEQNIIISKKSDTSRIITEVPAFGAPYTWRIIYQNNKGAKTTGQFYHFSTGIIPAVDTAVNHLRITQYAKQYQDATVFIDAFGVLYNMEGLPIWYLPDIKNTYGSEQLRDLKLSPLGTITFISGTRIYEVDYNGSILWSKPSADSQTKTTDNTDGQYHHQFTRLSNGHYMALGMQPLLCKLPSAGDSSFQILANDKIKKDTGKIYEKALFGNLTEYDENGNIVWVWKTSKYIMESDLIYARSQNGRRDPHDNAFYFDEKNKTIYISFRNINRVIKVKYPEGNVLSTYGKIYSKSDISALQHTAQDANGNSFFCGQHACILSRQGNLCLFDNTCAPSAISKILVMQEPKSPTDSLKIVWDYNCLTDGKNLPNAIGQNSGGNVIELPDQSFFASMGTQYSKVFIVNLNKEILWSAMVESRDQQSKQWRTVSLYRASIITSRKDLESLIWNSEKEQIPQIVQ